MGTRVKVVIGLDVKAINVYSHVPLNSVFLTVLKWIECIPVMLFTYNITIHKKIKDSAGKKGGLNCTREQTLTA